jgi:hypothetical protein
MGNCGNIQNVNVGGVIEIGDSDDVFESPAGVGFFYCTGKTSISKVRVIGGRVGLFFQNVSHVIVFDAAVASTDDHGGDSDDSDAGFKVQASQLAFVRPFCSHENDCFEIQEESSVTICTPFTDITRISSGSEEPVHLEENSRVIIAGRTSWTVDSIKINLGGGFAAFLEKCPAHFAAEYDMSLFTTFKTGAVAQDN